MFCNRHSLALPLECAANHPKLLATSLLAFGNIPPRGSTQSAYPLDCNSIWLPSRALTRRWPRSLRRRSARRCSTRYVAPHRPRSRPGVAETWICQTLVPTAARLTRSPVQPQVVAKLADVCFDKCVSKPGASLDRYESACLSQCALRYLETGQLIMSRVSGGGMN